MDGRGRVAQARAGMPVGGYVGETQAGQVGHGIGRDGGQLMEMDGTGRVAQARAGMPVGGRDRIMANLTNIFRGKGCRAAMKTALRVRGV